MPAMPADVKCRSLQLPRLEQKGVAMKTIYVSVRPEETRMGLVEDGRLQDYAVERRSGENLVGNVYRGSVRNVVPGIQAAFIDLNLGKNGFLTLRSEDHLTQGQMILVQVVKDCRGNKGPGVTRNITLPGRYVVLEPFGKKVSLSRKLTGRTRRNRLRELAERCLPEGMGLVVRTAAADAEDEEIQSDVEQLLHNWEVIQKRSKVGHGPQLLYRELDLSIRMIRDYVTDEIHEIIVDDSATCRTVRELLENMGLQSVHTELYMGTEDLFTHYGLDDEIAAISDRIVWLPGGGYLVFDYTEAMTVIDVNSGHYAEGESREETSLRTNREAAVEIARQLRLRDIGGIVVADFIDMDTQEAQEEVLQLLKRAFASDKMKPRVLGFTRLNLVEMTRRKARRNLAGALYTTCPMCQGSGRVESPETVYVEIRRRLRGLYSQHAMARSLLVTVHPQVYEWLTIRGVRDMEEEFKCHIRIASDPALTAGTFTILNHSA
jgi:ribonuclease G